MSQVRTHIGTSCPGYNRDTLAPPVALILAGSPPSDKPPMQLTLRDICKTYPNGAQALVKVCLTIPVGMYGLLGPNGAGKSTLMRILATLQVADSGSAMLGDLDALQHKDEVRKTPGYLPQEFGVYPQASAHALLDHLILSRRQADHGPLVQAPHELAQANADLNHIS